MSVSISPSNKGLQNLQTLVNKIKGRNPILSVPIVLVSGFSAWGEALFGTFNYWGGFEDLPTALNKAGYNVIVVRIGPLSSNWERACEVYAQLNAGIFDTPETPVATTITIDYGTEYPRKYGYEPLSLSKKAVLFGSLPSGWKWGAKNPLHFIAHSQGGNTMRLLIELMNGKHKSLHPEYFHEEDRQSWIKSLVTLGTPHKGTTITDVVQDLLPPQALDLITQLVTSVSFKKPRFYDLQLDHWGFSQLEQHPSETFLAMKTRIEPRVLMWWNGSPGKKLVPHNGFYDNSIEGVEALNNFAKRPSPHTFYFTMSFDASMEFPNESLTPHDLATFPSPLPATRLTNPFIDAFSRVGAGVISIGSRLPGVPSIVELAQWFVKVANSHLGRMAYFDRIPTPGRRIPRPDMLPLLLVTSIGMGGFEGRTPLKISSVDYQHNDGVVNTLSMRGPDDAVISDADFPSESLGSVLTAARARSVYWHLGTNRTMDHADEIGVFTVGETYLEVELMYKLFAQLLTRLP